VPVSSFHQVVLDHLGEGVAWTDPQGIVRGCNVPFARILGRSIAGCCGQPLRVLLPLTLLPDVPDSHELPSLICAPGKSLQNSEGLFQLITATHGLCVQLRVSTIENEPGFSGCVVTLQDVTERYYSERELLEARSRMEEKVIERTGELHESNELLRQVETKYRQILDAITDMILCKGPRSKIVWANKAFRDYYGMSNDQLRDLIDAPDVDPDITQNYVRDDAYVFETGKTLDIPVEPAQRYDGVIRMFHTVKSAILAPDGKVRMTVGVSRDITERDKLEQVVRVSEKMSAVGQLAAGVAHEINNPLSVILGFTEAMLRRVTEHPKLENALQSVNREALRCKTLVQSLLTFSRASRVELETVDINKEVNSASALIQAKAKVSDVRLQLDLTPNLTFIWANANQIQQIVINLGNNAIDAMEKGGTLTLKTSAVENMDHTPCIQLDVIDTGPGIPKDVLPRIFDPFFTTKPVGKGTGLGLALVHEIISKSNGRIDVKSRPGLTIFTVTFPQSSAIEKKAA